MIKALKPSQLVRHLKKLMMSVSSILAEHFEKDGHDISTLPIEYSLFNREQGIAFADSRVFDLLEGVSQLMFHSCRGVKGCLHSKCTIKLRTLLYVVIPLRESRASSKGTLDTEAVDFQMPPVLVAHTVSFVLARCVQLLLHHVIHSNVEPLWIFLIDSLEALLPYARFFSQKLSQETHASTSFRCTCQALFETLLYALSEVDQRKQLSNSSNHFRTLVEFITSFGLVLFDGVPIADLHPLRTSCSHLICQLWIRHPADLHILNKISSIMPIILRNNVPDPLIIPVSNRLLNSLPSSIAQVHLLPLLLSALRDLSCTMDFIPWISIVLRSIEYFETRKLIHESQLFPLEPSSVFNDFLSNVLDGIQRIYDYIEDTLLVNFGSDNFEVLFLACHTLSWLSKLLSKSLRHRTKTSDTQDALKLQLLHGIEGRGTALYSEMIHLECGLLSIGSSTCQITDVCKLLIRTVIPEFLREKSSVTLTWGVRCILELYIHNSMDHTEFPMSGILPESQWTSFFDRLIDTLRTGSHWLRVNILVILTYFPPPKLMINEQNSSSVMIDDCFDIAGCLFQAAQLPISLDSCREFARLIGNVEVIVRARRLPETHARMAMNFCLGMLHTKFQPYWEPLIGTITAIIGTYENSDMLWQQLLLSIEGASDSFHESAIEAAQSASIHDLISQMRMQDDGLSRYNDVLQHSAVFPFPLEPSNESGVIVERDTRVDPDTLFSNLWSILRLCPKIIVRRSKVIVPIFLRFIRNTYYSTFAEEPEVPDLIYRRVLDSACTAPKSSLSKKTLTARLEIFLSVFATVTGPKQLYLYSTLLDLYTVLVTKSDFKISKLALDCVFTYKLPALMPLKDNIYRIADDRTMRDELVTLDLREESGLVSKEHRAVAISFLSHLLYGKFSYRAGGSKAAREKGVSRRNAILSFLTQFETVDLEAFIHLLLRGILSTRVLNEIVFEFQRSSNITNDFVSSEWWGFLRHALTTEAGDDIIDGVHVDRLIAFLQYNEQLVKLLGHKLDLYVACFYRVIFASLKKYHSTDNQGPDTKLRSLCLIRLAQFVEVFQGANIFGSIRYLLEGPLSPIVKGLPSSLKSSKKPPALLKLFHTLAMQEGMMEILKSNSNCIETCVLCLSVRTDYNTFLLYSDILLQLLNLDQRTFLTPYSNLILDCLCRRFVCGTRGQDMQSYNLSDLQIPSDHSVVEELKLLLKISELLFSEQNLHLEKVSVSKLATVLLAMLRTYVNSKKVKAEEESALNILGAYRSLIAHLDDVSAHVPFLSKLFGPQNRGFSLLDGVRVRKRLVEIFVDISSHQSVVKALSFNAQVLTRLTAMDSKIIDSRDFNICIPVFHSLAASDTNVNWSLLFGPKSGVLPRESSHCHVVLHECLHSMYDSEALIRGAAEMAIKRLIEEALEWSGALTTHAEKETEWLDCFTAAIIPNIHTGIKQRNDTITKGFIRLIAHIVRKISGQDEFIESFPHFHGDLSPLLHLDPEQDFFENITHIQFHRRVRALNKARGIIKESSVFSRQTIVKIFLPIVYNMITSDELNKKESHGMMSEAASFIGALSIHLPWSQYYGIIKYLLRHLSHRNIALERSLLNALCSVLDSFHFDLTIKEDSSEESLELTMRISETLTQSILPWVQVYMTKEEKNKKDQVIKNVRPLVAVALAKLVCRLHPPLVPESKKRGLLDNLVLNIVAALKSRDSGARDAARDSLSRIITTLGTDMLFPVLYELDRSLTEGYQRHVRNYTIRSILSDTLTRYSPPKDFPFVTLETDIQSLDIDLPAFDKCIPLIVTSVLDDLAGDANQDRTADGAVRTLIREAKGTKANEIIEICARNILFRPSYALISPGNPEAFSTAHALISPLLNTLNEQSDVTIIRRLSEALHRAALGLSKNASLTQKEVLLYIYSSLDPILQKLAPKIKDNDVTVPSYLREHDSDVDLVKSNGSDIQNGVSCWNSSIPREYNQKTAFEIRDRERRDLHTVQDGFSAPKLTGVSRHKRARDDSGENVASPSTLAALKFILCLFYFCLKQQCFNASDTEIVKMVRPFLSALRTCLKIQGAADILISAIRCVSLVLSWEGINIDGSLVRGLGADILSLMFQGGALVSTDNDLVQACLKVLTSLFKFSENTNGSLLPLNVPTIRSMLQMLTPSIMESASVLQNSSFQLIRMIVDLKIVVPEIYDIVTHLCDQIALSNRKTVRDCASSTIIAFVLHYPVGENRLSAVMQRLITNCNYEFDDGRYASLEMLCGIVRALPVPVLEEHAVVIYLSIALRLVNEISSKCREKSAEVISALVRRVGKDVFAIIVDYTLQWLSQAHLKAQDGLSAECLGLMRAGCQVIAVVVDARSEDLKRSSVIATFLSHIHYFLSRLVLFKSTDSISPLESTEELGSLEQWVVTYYVVNALDKFYFCFPFQSDSAMCDGDLFELIQEALLYPHSWVRAAACRVIFQFLQRRDLMTKDKSKVIMDPKTLFGLARKLCSAMNQASITVSLLEPLNKCLLIVLQAMHSQAVACDPELPAADASADDLNEEDSKSNGSFWVIRRLIGIANNNQGARRSTVLRFFTAVVVASEELTVSYLSYMLELAVKVSSSMTEHSTDEEKEIHILAKTVLNRIRRLLIIVHI